MNWKFLKLIPNIAGDNIVSTKNELKVSHLPYGKYILNLLYQQRMNWKFGLDVDMKDLEKMYQQRMNWKTANLPISIMPNTIVSTKNELKER